jgi:hypothetical protein
LIRSPWRLAALAAAILTFAAAATASADTYTVYSCKGPTGVPNAAAGWAAIPAPTGEGVVTNACPTGGALSAVLNAATPTGGASASWRFDAPVDTSLVRFAAQRNTNGITSPAMVKPNDVVYILQTDHLTLETCVVSDATSCKNELTGAIDKQGIDSQYVLMRVICTNGGSTCSRSLAANLTSAAVGVKDALAPSVSGVRVIDTGDTSGILTVGYSAADRGGGVYRAIIKVDGQPAAVQPLGGPDCADANPADADPYQFLVPLPCPGAVNGAVTRINYRDLSAGPHGIEIAVEDAAGNQSAVFGPVQFPRLNAENAPSTPAGIKRLLNANLKVWFAKGKKKSFTSQYGNRVVTRGRLLDSRGKPVRGARIDVFHRLRSSGHRRLLKTGLKTRADGRITLILPLNVDARTIEYDYRALRPGKITSQQLLKLRVMRHGRTFIRKLKSPT